MPPSIISAAEIAPSGFEISSLISANDPVPVKNSKFISPIIDAQSSIAMDLNSGEILFEKNAHERLPIASITKLMTALVVLEENELNEIATVSNNAANTDGSTMHLRTGEEIAVENLLYGAIINSANDAAVALAEHNAGSVDEFIKKMNEKAKLLELDDTNFSNPIGLDQSNNYSSSYDIVKLGRYIYQNQFVKHAAELKELEVKSVSGEYVHQLESTNELLEDEYLNIKGLKTGSTNGAGLCLVSIAENDQNNEIITVVLDSPARFYETKVLVDWIFRAYNW
jgi:D-alanyl-D-alanine carboxypeptidase